MKKVDDGQHGAIRIPLGGKAEPGAVGKHNTYARYRFNDRLAWRQKNSKGTVFRSGYETP